MRSQSSAAIGARDRWVCNYTGLIATRAFHTKKGVTNLEIFFNLLEHAIGTNGPLFGYLALIFSAKDEIKFGGYLNRVKVNQSSGKLISVP